MPLTTKQQRFIEEYCVDFNATQAAIRAEYSEKTAYSQGQRLLKNVEIQTAIQRRLDELAMGPDEALKRLGDIARGSLNIFFDIDEEGYRLNLNSDRAKENMHLIKAIVPTRSGTKLVLHDAQSALIDILKMHGKFTDRVELTIRDKDYYKQFSYDELQEIKSGVDPDSILRRSARNRDSGA